MIALSQDELPSPAAEVEFIRLRPTLKSARTRASPSWKPEWLYGISVARVPSMAEILGGLLQFLPPEGK
jgi:hypothetical protein